jgi:molecular chaperone GrpE (heat shock protein)
MKMALAFLLVAGAGANKANPLGEVISLMNDLSAKVTMDKEAEAKAYKEYFEWCDDVSKNKQNEIKTATAQKEKLEATIAELTANIQSGDTKIGELAADISTSTADLASATAIREKESADFATAEKELVDVIDTLARAVTILEREMQKNPAALAQIANSGLQGVVQSLTAVVDAAAFSANDKKRLTALVQAQQGAADDDSDLELGAPAAAVYKTHSSNIFDVLEDLKEKAEGELSELRGAETSAKHNYGMLKQSLEDQLTNDNKDKDAETSGKAANEESKAIAEGDLEVTTADLKAGNEALATASSTCMQVAADHQSTVAARDAELKVIAEAIQILKGQPRVRRAKLTHSSRSSPASNRIPTLHVRKSLRL